MNVTASNAYSFLVTSSKSKSAKLYIIVLLQSSKKIEFYWNTRGRTNKAIYDFENVQVSKTLHNPLRLTIKCNGSTPWPKRQYFFQEIEYAEKFLDIVSPSVKLNENNKVSLGNTPHHLNSSYNTKDIGFTRKARGLVSKKKLRFQLDGFDLDLSYITPRIIAMGYPSEGLEAKYRNPLPEVQKFFKTYHGTRYRIYNLCSEKNYKAEKFENLQCITFPFDDHNPPPFNLFIDFCKDVDQWLDRNKNNIAAIHCKAGKGRTGTVIAAFLCYIGALNNAKDSLLYFAQNRTKNSQGVTIPSQRRYVAYFAKYLQQSKSIPPPYLSAPAIKLKKIIINTIPMFEDKGCTPFFHIYHNLDKKKELIHEEPVKYRYNSKEHVEIIFEEINVLIAGDLRVQFFDAGKSGNSSKKIFHTWFNTAFIKNKTYKLEKSFIDKARKDKKSKKFKYNFSVTFYFDFLNNTVTE